MDMADAPESEDLTEPAIPAVAGAVLITEHVKPAALRARQESARTKPGEVTFDRGDEFENDMAGFHYDVAKIHRDQSTTVAAADGFIGTAIQLNLLYLYEGIHYTYIWS
jgi:hypothetical protein